MKDKTAEMFVLDLENPGVSCNKKPELEKMRSETHSVDMSCAQAYSTTLFLQ